MSAGSMDSLLQNPYLITAITSSIIAPLTLFINGRLQKKTAELNAAAQHRQLASTEQQMVFNELKEVLQIKNQDIERLRKVEEVVLQCQKEKLEALTTQANLEKTIQDLQQKLEALNIQQLGKLA